MDISVFCILLAGILWGTMGIFVRQLGAYGFTPLQIACLRIMAAGILFFFCLFWTDRKKLRIQKKDFPLFLGMGWGSILFFTICYFTTIQRASLAVAAVLLYTSPIFVLLLSAVFLKEKITAKKLCALAMAFLGCVLAAGIGKDAHITWTALLTGLGSGLGYGLYSIFGSILLKKYHPYTVSSYAFIFAGSGAIFLCDAKNTAEKTADAGALYVLGFVLFMAAVTAVAPFLLYTAGLKKTEAGKAAVLATVEPLVAALVGIFLFQEALTVQMSFGIACIFLAVVLL